MAKCDALIGGGVPLQFFERAMWDGESLNLYHNEPESQEQWRKYLQDVEGYECVEDSNDVTGNPTMRFTRMSMRSSSHKIQILVVQLRDMPIQAILTGMPSTLFANCFSWNKAYSMHPWTTFIRHEILLGEPLSYDLKWTKPIKFYEQQGWKLRKWKRPRPCKRSDGLVDETYLLSRRVGDHHTWIIPFDTDGINETAKAPDFVLEYAAFCVNTPNSNGREPRSLAYGDYVFIAYGYSAAVLKHRYTTACYSWRQWLDQFMHDKTLEELHRLSPTDRPRQFELIVSNPRLRQLTMTFDKPVSWRYYDDEVPGLYEQWKSTLCCSGQQRPSTSRNQSLAQKAETKFNTSSLSSF